MKSIEFSERVLVCETKRMEICMQGNSPRCWEVNGMAEVKASYGLFISLKCRNITRLNSISNAFLKGEILVSEGNLAMNFDSDNHLSTLDYRNDSDLSLEQQLTNEDRLRASLFIETEEIHEECREKERGWKCSSKRRNAQVNRYGSVYDRLSRRRTADRTKTKI